MDVEQFEVLTKKLDAIIALLAQDKLVDKSKTEASIFLDQFGLDNSTIASIVGSTPGTVAARVSEAKKAKGDKKAKKDKLANDNNQENETEPVEGIPSYSLGFMEKMV